MCQAVDWITTLLEELDVETEFFFEEGLVRARLDDALIAKLVEEMKLDPRAHQTWIDLERMTVWQ